MKKLTRDKVVYAMDKNNPPALHIDPGETVILETEDCFCYFYIVRHSPHSNTDFGIFNQVGDNEHNNDGNNKHYQVSGADHNLANHMHTSQV